MRLLMKMEEKHKKIISRYNHKKIRAVNKTIPKK